MGSWGQPVYIHLSRAAPEDVRSSEELRILVGHGLDGLFEAYRDLEIEIVFPPVSQPWRLREFVLREIQWVHPQILRLGRGSSPTMPCR